MRHPMLEARKIVANLAPSFLFLVVRPGAPSSVLVTTSKALVPSSVLLLAPFGEGPNHQCHLRLPG